MLDVSSIAKLQISTRQRFHQIKHAPTSNKNRLKTLQLEGKNKVVPEIF
jgi:hypothetical protein